MRYLFRFTFLLALAACVYLMLGGCAMLKRAAQEGGPVALAGAAGALAGPVTAGVAAGAVAIYTSSESQNSDLKDGTLTGEKAKDKEIERLRLALANRPVLEVEVDKPFIPTWVKWVGALGVAWFAFKLTGKRYRENVFAAIKCFIKLRLPSAIQAVRVASGRDHSRPKNPIPHTEG